MPQLQQEQHPYLEQGKVTGARSLVLGSFPVYECTNPDNEEKQLRRQKMTTRPYLRFFYGSTKNNFWPLYQQYIDPQLSEPFHETQLMASIQRHKIAFADTIESCWRKDYSALDKNLHGKSWNRTDLQNLLNTGITRILCTSKGVLADLERQIICVPYDQPFGQLLEEPSRIFQQSFLHQLGTKKVDLAVPIARVFAVNGHHITALAIPSPGSPYRQIRHFGHQNGDLQQFAVTYFAAAFAWLLA